MTRHAIARAASGALTAAVMSGAVSAAMLLANARPGADFLGPWLASWALGFAIALPVGWVVAPLSDRLRQRILGGQDSP